MSITLLLLQVSIIIAASRLTGLIFRRIHQPQVMGEMIAGILLGPSLLGWLAPGISLALFPPSSLGFLNALSQIGLLIFMFLVGLELEPKTLREQRRLAFTTSIVSFITPFLLGILLAFYLYPRVSIDGVKFTHFALFLGTAMSVTALPVLARILIECNLLRTRLGTAAIACAAVGDVTSWCLLAGVVMLVRSTSLTIPLWLTLLGSAVYICLMLFIVRRMLNKLVDIYLERRTVSQSLLTIILLLVFASSWVTESLGIHALFGAFLMGAVMPTRLVEALSEKLEDVTVVLLLPLFFAYTGLRTSITLVSGAEMWFYCSLIIAVAIAGKFGGATLAARATGKSWRDAGALGILMNTRGLMELVILNIGLDIGVISPAVFAMMVMMTLITTSMTTPLLKWVYSAEISSAVTINAKTEESIRS
ncbi:MAG: cation:proton antiporter [Acidobacteria bacterium]|nr:cation:proton antiporter [Acidobacteriota bacterium]